VAPAVNQARTRLARAAVVDAARALFLERGYAATTMDVISTESGIPAPTVYRLFSSKLGVLRSLIEQALAGDGDPVPIEHRDRVRALLSGDDPRAQLAGLAAIVREINGRATSAYPLLVSAGESDPAAAELLAEYQGRRRRGQGLFASALARLGALRPGLGERDAADIMYAIASPEVYRMLVTERGWAPERFERWLAGTLAEQLLSRQWLEGKNQE
jgi:AcrR family transcriptional regulator